MRQTTRRFWVRTAFVLLCAAPTAATLVVLAVRRTPPAAAAAKAAYANQLASQLGLSVSLDRLHFPRPGAALLEGVQWSDPETGEELARARLMEVVAAQGVLRATASQPEIQVGKLPALCEALHDRLFRSAPAARPVEAAAREVTLHGSPESLTLRDVRCHLQSGADGALLAMEFRLAGEQAAAPIRVHAIRNRQVSPPATRWELNTGETPVPCSILAPHVAILGRLGARCRFAGSLRATRAEAGWEGDLSGRFLDVDLDRLITDGFPHKLSGQAEALIRQARFRAGRITSAVGSLVCDGGVVSRSLMLAAAESLQWTGAPRLETDSTPLWRYERLAFEFTMSEDGSVTITGVGPPPGAILADSQGALLAGSPERPILTAALVRVLAPRSELQAPVAKETEPLLRALPLPSVLPRDSSAAQAPYRPLRLK